MKLVSLAGAGLALASLPIFASTIVSELGGTGGTGGAPAFAAVDWTQTSTYTDVTIDALLEDDGLVAPAQGVAYLMSKIGPGSTSANEVTSPFSFSVPYGPGVSKQLFSGLTLGPGTYYLVIEPTSNFAWQEDTAPGQTLSSGVTQGPDELFSKTVATFAPATAFTPQVVIGSQNDDTRWFSVTGTLSSTPTSATPEPSMFVLLAIGLGGLLVARLRRGSQLH
jgi:hypothetical protein